MVSDFRETRVYKDAVEDGYAAGLQQGYSVAFKLGFDAGKKEAAIMIARRMLAIGLQSKQIEEATGLSLSAVQRLKKKLRI